MRPGRSTTRGRAPRPQRTAAGSAVDAGGCRQQVPHRARPEPRVDAHRADRSLQAREVRDVDVVQGRGQRQRRQAADAGAAGADGRGVDVAVDQLQQHRRGAQADAGRDADARADGAGDGVADQLAGEELGRDDRHGEHDRQHHETPDEADQEEHRCGVLARRRLLLRVTARLRRRAVPARASDG